MLLNDDISHAIQEQKRPFHWELVDKHYLLLWDKRDLPTVFKFCKAVRESDRAKKEELLDIFASTIDRKLNDHHIPQTNLVPESLEMAVREDILTFRGIARFCQLICLKSTAIGHTVAVGTGTTGAEAFDQFLIDEKANIQISKNGFWDPSGIRVWYGGTFGESVPSYDFTESCVRDQASVLNAVLFCRNVFVGSPMHHEEGNSGFTAAGVFEFIPIQ